MFVPINPSSERRSQKKSDSKNQTFLKTIIAIEEMALVTEIIFANLLDVIPLISNTETEINQAILRIYERNAAFFLDMNHEFLIQHPEERNFTE